MLLPEAAPAQANLAHCRDSDSELTLAWGKSVIRGCPS
jgi:hypothetical protein